MGPNDEDENGKLFSISHCAVKVGEINRFVITFVPNPDEPPLNGLGKSLWVRIKNVEMVALRAAYLAGPFTLYCDVRPEEYTHKQACFSTADQPSYEPNLSPGQSFYAELPIHLLKDKYTWTVDVVSQMIFSSTAETHFELFVGTSKSALHRQRPITRYPELDITIQDTQDLWNIPPRIPEKPVHLVLLTHGLHSNCGADMFFLKERIEEAAFEAGQNVIVRGYRDNVCKTERGVRYLGGRVARYAISQAEEFKATKISFVAHSLGGLTQVFAIGYIAFNYPGFFDRVKPENFITLASPYLGLTNENPGYVNLFLSAGIVGKTGQDLGLYGLTPLLLMLPGNPTAKILQQFKRRTLYANSMNDGIVPLRTSALLYLDWRGLSRVNDEKTKDSLHHQRNSEATGLSPENISENGANVGEIPRDSETATEGVNASTTGNAVMDLGNTLKDMMVSPLQSVMAFCAPHIQAEGRKSKKYRRFQTMREDGYESGEDDDGVEGFINPLPKTSLMESATKVLLPPAPPFQYLVNPSSREEVIIHDRIYTEKDLPKEHKKSKSRLEILKEKRDIEERIARKYHRNAAWRKVLVKLLPDAHNNIIVRRRFSNAYGWLVIDHLVDNHFGSEADVGVDSGPEPLIEDAESDKNEEKFEKILLTQKEKDDKRAAKEARKYGAMSQSSSQSIGRTTLDLHRVDTNDTNETKGTVLSNDGRWINDNDSDYYDGPAGIFSNAGEALEALKAQYQNGIFTMVNNEDEVREVADPGNSNVEGENMNVHVMGSFY